MRTLIIAAVGLAVLSGGALAQGNQPRTGAGWLTHLQAGQWQATKLKGLNVYNSNNEKIGDINELIVDQGGSIKAAIIGVGGFLGMGEHDVAVPFNELKWVNDPPRSSSSGDRTGSTTGATGSAREGGRTYPDHAVLNMTKDQLKAAPAFKYSK